MTISLRETENLPPKPTGLSWFHPFALAALISVVPASSGVEPDEVTLHGWKALAPLPDPVGFGGMFAGVLNGRLAAGGGTQWDKPIWLKGEKLFSDRIFTLATPSGAWTEHASRLPVKSGHFASATTPDAIYLAGGIDSTGCLRSVFELSAQGDELVYKRLPDLPQPIGYASAAMVGGRFYVVGGLREPTAKVASSEVWSLGLDAPVGAEGWRREADLPGPGVFVAASASDGITLYVFGGIGFDAAGEYAPSARAFRLNPLDWEWERLTDLPEPRVGAASPCPVLPGNRILVVGGYAEVFPGEARDHPGFSAQTLYYDITRHTWERGPTLPVTEVPDRDSPGDPGPAPMIGAPCVVWHDQVIIISGEVRASVRTPAVLARPSLHLDPIPVDESAQVKTPR